MSGEKRQKTIVVGAGPVGALAALYAATRGDEVHVYDLRSDLRDPDTTPLNFTNSINLALSERGINALRHLRCPGLLEDVLEHSIPMYARMIHGRDTLGNLYEQPQTYDVHGRAIRAIDRAGLNKRLLDELDALPNVSFHFNHKLTGADFHRNLAWFETQDPHRKLQRHERHAEIEIPFDFMIGADGAHSAVRYHLMKFARMDYRQDYIDTLWCEFKIPPKDAKDGGGWRLSPNHLHIWPGGEFMFIAIPSFDQSFICTLFLPPSHFTSLSASPSALTDFFAINFPGVTPDLISPADLQHSFDHNPHLPLISINCTPYHFQSSCVILGDAAHAMVPFYGQGMNCGLEDVRLLYEFLDRHDPPASPSSSSPPQAPPGKAPLRATALAAYTAHRTPDTHTITSLALQNYTEMRSSVTSPLYQARKWAEEHANLWFPSLGWETRYARVSFGNERYGEVERHVREQGRLLVGGVMGVLGLVGMGVGVWGWRRWGR
ncbi:MAG: kynurenine 3-monooxygenase, mitochondrial precursor [Caeruleum heppii]|nr:MAG: kynurenine 3-monooxygenase, mitochondrial precursor [Caeruleum heppii]